MYKCEVTGKISEAQQPANKIVVERRSRTYEYYDKEGKLKSSEGWEIVKEILVSEEGLKKLSV